MSDEDREFHEKIKPLVERLLSKSKQLNVLNEKLLDAEKEYNDLNAEYSALGLRIRDKWRELDFGPRKDVIECRSDIQQCQNELLNWWIGHIIEHASDE